MKDSIAELLTQRDHRSSTRWAADCAERVLPYFEEQYPKDYRPRKAIDAARAWAHGKIRVSQARTAATAAHAAARSADDRAAQASARAAGHAAATAHMVAHAPHAATYAAFAASLVSTSADAGHDVERDWQYQHLLELTDTS